MITLFVENGVAYVWNSEDWFQLRSQYRICGNLIGSAPSFPRQNDFTGLPMALMSEEAALLVEKGFCQLCMVPKIIEPPSEIETKEFKEAEEKIFEEQAEAFQNKKIEQLSQKIDIIVAGKRQKMLSKGAIDVDLDKDLLLQEEINKLPPLAPVHALVHIPSEHIFDLDKTVVPIDVLDPSVTDNNGLTHFTIFKDLWNKGYYITNGSKFGSDYLLYPGDPVRFHAMYMVRCISEETSVQPSYLVAYGRLSVAVNKHAVLAFCNRFNKVEYQTLQWHESVI